MEKHPKVAVDSIIATSTSEQISIADAQQKHKKSPWKILWIIFLVLIVVTVPYGIGRNFTLHDVSSVIWILSQVRPVGWAMVSWSVMVVGFIAFAKAVIEASWWTWGVVSYCAFVIQQFLSGLAMFQPNYWWGTKVIFGSHAVYANGINAGILCATWALAVFIVVYIVELLFIKKNSRLNVFTRSWSAFPLFFIIELGGLVVALFGGIL